MVLYRLQPRWCRRRVDRGRGGRAVNKQTHKSLRSPHGCWVRPNGKMWQRSSQSEGTAWHKYLTPFCFFFTFFFIFSLYLADIKTLRPDLPPLKTVWHKSARCPSYRAALIRTKRSERCQRYKALPHQTLAPVSSAQPANLCFISTIRVKWKTLVEACHMNKT